eukprot:6030962-Prymnesium_polylepis.1
MVTKSKRTGLRTHVVRRRSHAPRAGAFGEGALRPGGSGLPWRLVALVALSQPPPGARIGC